VPSSDAKRSLFVVWIFEKGEEPTRTLSEKPYVRLENTLENAG
jgi:hypothetical protein